MNTHELQDLIIETLEEHLDVDFRNIVDFEHAGLLTRDHGLVIALKDGTEFQLGIVRSR